MSYLPTKNPLTKTQRDTAEILATNDIHKKTIQEIADDMGVNPRTIYRWKKDPVFIAYQNSIAERAMEDFLTEAYTVLKKLLREGRSERTQLEALKLILQNRGKLDNKHEHVHEVKQTKSLDELEREVVELEQDLLDDIE
jgi:transposase-like protein